MPATAGVSVMQREKSAGEISLARGRSVPSVRRSAVSPHRLARLGHYPFTVRTGVRIPVGTPIFKARSSEELRAFLSVSEVAIITRETLLMPRTAFRPTIHGEKGAKR